MRVILPVYGLAVWKPMLDAWLRRWEKTGNAGAHELRIISDGREAREWLGDGYAGVPVDHYAVELPVFSTLNMSGHLLAKAALWHSPCLVVTLDCVVQHRLPALMPQPTMLALGEDPDHREWPMAAYGGAAKIEEYNCAVAWFGSGNPGVLFGEFWQRGVAANDERMRSVTFWEQVVWSLVWAELTDLQKGVYARAWNWSHWWGSTPDAHIVHWHGNKKWEKCLEG